MKKIILAVLGWRALLFLVAGIAPLLLSAPPAGTPTFPYRELLMQTNLPSWLYSWANFDGVHYLTIVAKGYLGTGLIQAFFPLFPVLVAGLVFFPQPIVVGIGLNLVLAIILALFWSKLLKKYGSEHILSQTWWLWLVFPTTFFLGAFYTEALFLSLVISSFYCASEKKWGWAGFLAALASATRIVGIVLVLGLLVEYFVQHWPSSSNNKWVNLITIIKKGWLELLAILSGSMGLLAYMGYLFITFQDPLYFSTVQKEFGTGRDGSFVIFPQVVYRAIRSIVISEPSFLWYSFIQDLVLTLGTLLLLALGWWWILRKKTTTVRLSWLTFATVVFFIPPLTGTLSSMPRYVLACFPLFIILAELLANLPRSLRFVVYFLLTSVQVFNILLFIQGYWVA